MKNNMSMAPGSMRDATASAWAASFSAALRVQQHHARRIEQGVARALQERPAPRADGVKPAAAN